jgi:putative effector of murein hydrolase
MEKNLVLLAEQLRAAEQFRAMAWMLGSAAIAMAVPLYDAAAQRASATIKNQELVAEKR